LKYERVFKLNEQQNYNFSFDLLKYIALLSV